MLINQSVLLLLPLGEWRRKARCHASVATECGTINATVRRHFWESKVEHAELPATCSRGNQSAAAAAALAAVAVAVASAAEADARH